MRCANSRSVSGHRALLPQWLARAAMIVLATVAASLGVTLGMTRAQAGTPQFYTNQSFVEDAVASPSLPITNPVAMFAYVLANLPERVKVYPTENYYYFSFTHDHVRYAGNIRLDVVDRDQGKVNFAYYVDLAEWKDQDPITYILLDQRNGVKVEKLEPLVYRISYGTRSVIFELNDLSSVKPPPSLLGADETYIGPVFDESAMQFFLIFNRKLKLFHYVLDETIPIADQLIPIPGSERILIGKRTGFALLSRRQDRAQNPDRSVRGQFARQQLLRRPVRPAARQLHRRRDAARGDPRSRPEPERQYRPLWHLAGRPGPLPDRALPALSQR